MRRFLARWCWMCTAIGAVLVLAGASASAQDANGAVMGFQARDIITGLLGLLLTVVGAYTAGFSRRVDKLDEKVEKISDALTEFKQVVAKEYHDKQEVSDQLSQVNRSVEALHRRFDQLNVPQVPRT